MTTPTTAAGLDVTRTCQDEPDTFTTAALVAALEEAWAAIRARHPEVPEAVIVLGSGSPAKASQRLKYGHFQRHIWQAGTNRLPEVLVSGEGLARTPGEVFTTLLHEATHGLADTRGVKDTSRQGRWHNKEFAKLAAELGMTTTKDDKLGFSPCTLTDIAAARYKAQITAIGEALTAYRHTDVLETKERTNNNNGVSAECECPRKLRVSIAVFDAGPIWCGECGEAFLPEETDRDAFNTEHPKPTQPCTHADNGDEDQGDEPESVEEDENVKFYDPTGQRFGIPTYPFHMAPEGLATIRQLRAKGLRPNGQQPAAQVLWRKGDRVAYLYRIDQAAPKRTASPAQREAIDKALLARRTCPSCNDIKPYYIPRQRGECLDCTTGGAR